MAKTERWIVMYQDAGDGSEDIIVELPSELLEKLGWETGDELAVKSDDGKITLKLNSRAVDSSS